MVKACVKEERGDDGRLLTVTSSSEILQQFTDLAWLQKRAQEKAEAAALAQAAISGVEAQPTPDEAAADAHLLSGEGHHSNHHHGKEGADRRRSTKQYKRKQSRS